MATVKAHKRAAIDVKISFSFKSKPSYALYESVRSFITPRSTKSIFPCASDISESTAAGLAILWRTELFQSKASAVSTLRKHFKQEESISEIRVEDCNDIEKESLEKSECNSMERTDVARPSCRQDNSIKDIGICASQNGSVASQVILENQDIGSGDSQSSGSVAQSQISMAHVSNVISFRLASWKAEMPAEDLLLFIRQKASEAVIDVTSTEEGHLDIKIKCVWKSSMHSTTIRRHIQATLPSQYRKLKIFIHTMDRQTVRSAYVNMPVQTEGSKRWLQYSLDKCAAYEMTLSELASRIRASAVDEEKRLLACITRKHYKADCQRKLLLIINLADAVARKCSDSHAYGPSTKAQIDPSGIQEARAETESVPASVPGAPPATSSPPPTRRCLGFSSDAGAAASCAAPIDRDSAPNSTDAASAESPKKSPGRKKRRGGTKHCKKRRSADSNQTPVSSAQSTPEKDCNVRCLDSGQAIPASQTAAAGSSSQAGKRVRVEDANGCKGLSLHDFGDKGLETKARLDKLISDSDKKCGYTVVEALVEKHVERCASGKSTSGGEVGRYTVCARQKATSKLRRIYGNLCANLHCECGCRTTQTDVREDGSAPEDGEGGGFMQEAVPASGVTAGSSEGAAYQSKGTVATDSVLDSGSKAGTAALDIAELVVESMDQDVLRELALAEVHVGEMRREDVYEIQESIMDQHEAIRAPGGGDSPPPPRAIFLHQQLEAERRAAAAKAVSPDEVPVLNERNKEELKKIIAGIISDMSCDAHQLLALEPRIQRWSLANSPRFKQRIIDEYKAKLSARRKSEIGLLKAASTLSMNNVSTRAYRAVRTVLCDLGFKDALPTEKDLDEARKLIETNAVEDLVLKQTEDGWCLSIRALIEMELLRHQQRTLNSSKSTRKESGARSIGHAGPGMNGWQDVCQVKITLDARRITKKTSQTELMMHIFKGGEEGSKYSQSALCMRTVGIFTGKDSREGVQANLTELFRECQDLAVRGVLFNVEKQAFLGQLEAFSQLSEEARQADATAEKHARTYFPVRVKFWCPADMAAQCAILGHGCAGHHYCAHCEAHADERHLPYALRTMDKATNFSALAHEYDMHPKTLFALNAREDHAKVQPLTLQGLRDSTAMDAAARALLAAARESEPDQEVTGARRKTKKTKRAPVAKHDPDEGVLKQLDGWRDPSKHTRECECEKCLIPKGTCVRVIPRPGFSRPSDYLKQHFPALTAERCPFCALHCLMRVTESLFQQICHAAQSSSKRAELIVRMNQSFRELKINVQYKQTLKTKEWEKVTFEGHQAKALLATDKDGKMGIERLLEAMWPGSTGNTAEWGVDEKEFGTDFVPRVVEMWKQWAVVDRLMSERFVEKLRADVVDGEDGFARFGKECREFIFRFQSMATQDFSKAYYLHTLLHHAGDFMRALEAEGMTLGMVSNSGAERRHEFGRRACRKALASNGWRKKNPEYDALPNLIVYLTLKELLMWDYGDDLISHEIARLSSEGQLPGPGPLLQHKRVGFKTSSRRSLLSATEYLQEAAAEPYDPPPCFETSNKEIWRKTLRGRKQTYELIGMKHEHDSDEEDVLSSAVAGDLFGRPKKASWDPDCEPLLFSGVCPAFPDDDGNDEGSEVDESDAGPWFDSAAGLTVNSFPFPNDDEEEWEDSASEASVEALEFSDSGEEKDPSPKFFRSLGVRRVPSKANMSVVSSSTAAAPVPHAMGPPPEAHLLPVAAPPPPNPAASGTRRTAPARGRGRGRG